MSTYATINHRYRLILQLRRTRQSMRENGVGHRRGAEEKERETRREDVQERGIDCACRDNSSETGRQAGRQAGG